MVAKSHRRRVQSVGTLGALALGAAALIAPSSGGAATVLSYDFEAGNTPAVSAPGLSAGAWAPTNATNFLTGQTGNPGAAIQVVGWGATTTLSFSLTIGDSLQLALDSVRFDERSAGTGMGGGGGGGGATRPFDTFNLVLDDPDTPGIDFTLISSGAIGGTSAWTTPAQAGLGLSGLSGTFDVIFTGNATNNGNWRIDNFVFDGTVTAVPLPPAAVLLLSGLGTLIGWRRRRSA